MPAAIPPHDSQDNTPLVSLIVRTIGRPELRLAIDSIRAQTWPAIEIVLVLANPEFQPGPEFDDPRIRMVRAGRRLPRPDAANAGLDATSGDWIGFLDEDDQHLPNHVETLLDAARGQDARLVYGDLIVGEPGREQVLANGYWKARHTDHPIPHLIGMLLSRELIDRHGCRFDSDFEVLEDWDFFLQCAEHTDFLHVGAPVARYNGHLGTSGCGIGANRDETRVRAGLARMTEKWGQRYRQLVDQAEAAGRAADAALGARDFMAAERHARAGLAADPGNPTLLNRLAYCRRLAGDWPGVLAALRRACDSDPLAFRMKCDLTVLEHRHGEPARARELLDSLATLAESEQDRTLVSRLMAELRPDAAVGRA